MSAEDYLPNGAVLQQRDWSFVQRVCDTITRKLDGRIRAERHEPEPILYKGEGVGGKPLRDAGGMSTGCLHRYQASIPYTRGQPGERVDCCVVCDGVYLWPSVQAALTND